jgi:cytochrome c oxidase assembly protein subunit 15
MPASASRPVAIWLLTGCLLIAAMVTVGGVTRLTGSGLSITEWNVLMGALPPQNQADWLELFRKYQASPQFQLLNPHFALADFQKIFWWEYLHRLIARLMGVVFLVPFAWFLLRGHIDRALRNRVALIFALGALQGVLGWAMVASGLVDRPAVSHYRLAAHLLTALVTFAVTLWVALGLLAPARRPAMPEAIRWQARVLAALFFLQVMYGAFVAGLKAGFIYNTFPLMGNALVPRGLVVLSPAWINLTENPVTVQFIHRLLGWALALLGAWLWFTLRVHGMRGPANLLLAALATQFTLGILTILNLPGSPVFWGAVHQAGAVALLTAVVNLLFALRPGTAREGIIQPAAG